jgi:hypothetical protein
VNNRQIFNHTTNKPNSMNIPLIITLSGMAFVATVAGGMYGCPKYFIYSQTMRGTASLKEAEWTKKIQIEEAKGKEEAALMTANARVTQAEAEGKSEIARAKATAEANRIIGDSLQGNESYLRYLWIMGLKDGNGERIYIPTEAGLPILEAGKAKN